MQKDDWKKLKYFVPEEFDYPSRMSLDHLLKLDTLRACTSSIIITSDYRPNDNGTHGRGIATDIIFSGKKREELLDLYIEIERHNFAGIGIYPHWKIDGEEVGGFHLDSRPLKSGCGARWLCILVNGKQEYIALNKKNLLRYPII